jgi:hypothetical protein
MSHFAKIDENNIVTNVVVADNSMPNEGYDWVVSRLGGRWIKTSYNGNIRGRFAGIGYTYNEELDVFVAPKPYGSWVLNPETTDWEPPVAKPEDGSYVWDESSKSWLLDATVPPVADESEHLFWDEESQSWVAE